VCTVGEMSRFANIASEVEAALSHPHVPTQPFREVASGLREAAAKDRDQEWQRVNSYIADVLKDAHVLYSKLARLQGDFIGTERNELEKISESVLDIGEKLSHFMKAFHSGEADMLGQTAFGEEGAPPGTPPPEIPGEFGGKEELPKGDFEEEIRLDEEGDLSEFEEETP
jgi:hypothetical protein